MYGSRKLNEQLFECKSLLGKVEGSFHYLVDSDDQEEQWVALADLEDRAQRLLYRVEELHTYARSLMDDAGTPSADEARDAEIRED